MNMKADPYKPKTRMIHIRLPEQLHKRLRIRAAESDITIQEWVVDALETKIDKADQSQRS
ncbi:toxin-antitoxin system HicB family antitoxin, partial [Chloroflexota bacterium]